MLSYNLLFLSLSERFLRVSQYIPEEPTLIPGGCASNITSLFRLDFPRCGGLRIGMILYKELDKDKGFCMGELVQWFGELVNRVLKVPSEMPSEMPSKVPSKVPSSQLLTCLVTCLVFTIVMPS
jgi:hypothetical protein